MIPDELVDAVRGARHVCVLTGAGGSAESGVPTFRDAQTGLWAKYDPLELATPELDEAGCDETPERPCDACDQDTHQSTRSASLICPSRSARPCRIRSRILSFTWSTIALQTSSRSCPDPSNRMGLPYSS